MKRLGVRIAVGRCPWRAPSATTASSSGGIAGTNSRGEGAGWFTCMSAIATALSPSNGALPGEQLEEHDADRVDVGCLR